MSNSFPSMISNEPPELLSDEDEDSEEFRDFSSGLRFDIDPSPISSPRKSKLGHTSTPSPLSLPSSLPNGNQSSSPDNSSSSNNSSNNPTEIPPRADKESSHDEFPSPTETISSTTTINSSSSLGNNTTNSNSICVNNVMKTSYIGTIETLDQVDDNDNDAEGNHENVSDLEWGKVSNDDDDNKPGSNTPTDNSIQPPVPVFIPSNSNVAASSTEEAVEKSSQQVTPPSNFQSLVTTENGDGDDEFDDFQEFQKTSSDINDAYASISQTIQEVGQELEEENESIVKQDKDTEENIYVDSSNQLENILNADVPIPSSSSGRSSVDETKFEDACSGSNNNELTDNFCDCSSEMIMPSVIETQEQESIPINQPKPSCDSITEKIQQPPEMSQDASAAFTAQIGRDEISFPADFSSFGNEPAESSYKETQEEATLNQGGDSNNEQQDDDDFGDFDHFQDFQTSSTTSQKTVTQGSFTLNANTEALSQISSSQLNGEDDSITKFEKLHPIASTFDNPQQISANFDSFTENNGNDDDDDFDDFADFQAFQSPPPSSSQSVPMPLVKNSSSAASQSLSDTLTTTVIPSSSFSSATTAPLSLAGESFSLPPSSSLALENKFETLVKSLFSCTPIPSEIPENISNFKPIDKELKEDRDNEEWSRVEDFEGSQGLLFKWLNSCAYQKLLKSLKVDSSTIMYSGKWGAIEVPRFAASLVDSPLLPESKVGDTLSQTNTDPGISNPSNGKSEHASPSENECSNGTGGSSAKVTPEGQISQEAEQILTQIPDLSYMRSKTIVFPNVLQVQTLARDV